MAKLTEDLATTAETELDIDLTDEAKLLGVKISRLRMAGFKGGDPAKISKEEAKHRKLIAQRIKNRIEKARIKAKMKPIDLRRAVLVGRFKAVRARARAYTYSNKNVAAWTEEFNLINNNPKLWIKITANGTKPFTPGNKKKKSAKDILDGMDLD